MLHHIDKHFGLRLTTGGILLKSFSIKLSTLDVIFGMPNELNDIGLHTLNFCILFAKQFLYNCKINSTAYQFRKYRLLLKERLDAEQQIAMTNDYHEKFIEKWETIYQNLAN